jgi:hypothetical protein
VIAVARSARNPRPAGWQLDAHEGYTGVPPAARPRAPSRIARALAGFALSGAQACAVRPAPLAADHPATAGAVGRRAAPPPSLTPGVVVYGDLSADVAPTEPAPPHHHH